VFDGVAVDGAVMLELVDVDASANDPIGSGVCEVGQTCRVGQATVTVSLP
jgi:hypothetical protein